MFTLKFIEPAKDDVNQAYLWYEEKRIGLGEDFLLTLTATSLQIERSPKLHNTIYKNKRRVLMQRFPYAVVYEIRDDIIYVMAVIHTSRHPKRWEKRS